MPDLYQDASVPEPDVLLGDQPLGVIQISYQLTYQVIASGGVKIQLL
jgi:hypothetical protein